MKATQGKAAQRNVRKEVPDDIICEPGSSHAGKQETSQCFSYLSQQIPFWGFYATYN